MDRAVSATRRKICQILDSIQNICLKTVRWQIPEASFVYLMTTNALFWITVFYTEWIFKFTIMCGLCTLLFMTNVIYPISILSICTLSTTQRSKIHDVTIDQNDSSSSGANLAALLNNILLVPLKCIVLPPLNVLSWIINFKFVDFTIMLTSGLTAVLLLQNKDELACWIAYLSIIFIYMVPPWRHNRITEKFTNHSAVYCSSVVSTMDEHIVKPSMRSANFVKNAILYIFLCRWVPVVVREINQCWIKVKSMFIRTILEPVANMLSRLKAALAYVFFGYWIPPLCAFVFGKLDQFCRYINETLILPFVRFLKRLKDVIVYYFGGYWILPLMERLRKFLANCQLAFRTHVTDPFLAKCKAVGDFFIYWFGGYWIPPFCRWLSNYRRKCYGIFIQPIIDFFLNFTENMIFILSGCWIPAALNNFNAYLCQPVVNFALNFHSWLIFICYGHWIPILTSFLNRKKLEFLQFIDQKCIKPLKNYILSCAANTKLFILRCIDQLIDYLRTLAIKIKMKMICAKNRLMLRINLTIQSIKIYLLNDVWIPFKRKTRRFIFRLKLYIKYKIFYPALRHSILAFIYSCEWICLSIIKPALELLYEYTHTFVHYFIAEYGYPFWVWFSKQLPEKSPFIDDSDTELKDYLPNVDEESSHSESEAPAPTRAYRQKLPLMLRTSKSSSSLEEAEFSLNMEIPAVDQADSDEEQELAMAPFNTTTTSAKPAVLRGNGGERFQKNVEKTSRTKLDSSAAALSLMLLSGTTPGGDGGSGSASTFKDLFSSAASFAVEQASSTASYLNSRVVSKLMQQNSGVPEKNNSEALSFEKDLEPDFELIDNSDVEK